MERRRRVVDFDRHVDENEMQAWDKELIVKEADYVVAIRTN
jgi:hypothetical protein